MSKTKKLFIMFMLICMAAIGMIIYMLCTFGNSNGVIEDFELVQEKSGNWDESVVENLEVDVIYQLKDYERIHFKYMNEKVSDIDSEKGDFLSEYSNGRQKEEKILWYGEEEVVHHGYYNEEKNQYVIVTMSATEESYTLNVYVEGEKVSLIKAESYTFKLDEETIKANKLLEEKAENQNINASDYVSVNGVTNGITIITVTQICGQQDVIGISYDEDENGMVNNIKFSKIDSNKDSKVYMSTLVDTCKGADGTVYVCYLEGLRDKEPEYTESWARRMMVDGIRWNFEDNSGKGTYFWNEEYVPRYRFNGIAVRAYKNTEENSKMVYYGYFESEISKLFVENIERVRNANELIPSEIEVDLIDLKLSVKN